MIGCILINSPQHSIMNQEEAYQFCYHKDSRLLELYTKEQWKLLDEILGTKNLKVRYRNIYISTLLVREGARYDFWVGGSDLGHEDDWRWLNSGEDVPDFIWDKPYQGDDGVNQNCMFLNSGSHLAWDTPCSAAVSQYPLCQKI